MSDFRAFEKFIEKVETAAQPLDKGTIDYFYYIIKPDVFDELIAEIEAAYDAARKELAANVKFLLDKGKLELIGYLNEAKSLLVEPHQFNDFIIESYTALIRELAHSAIDRSIGEEAFVQMQQLIVMHFEASTEKGASSPVLAFSFKERIATLQLVGTGASERWVQLQAAVSKQLRLASSTLPVETSNVKNRQHDDIADFNEEVFIELLGFDTAMLTTFDNILVGMRAIERGPNDKWRPTQPNAKGLSFIALLKLLIAFKQVDKPDYGDLAQWKMFFKKRYRASITNAVSRYQIDTTKSKPFHAELRSCNRLIIRYLPNLKGVYHLPSS
ncbi:hypothetical protein [Hymenobacter arizonensis]|uniref:Uncharacterized protein n=1 Tax=Hymenobacter arizonensis TaxID=1227077 RepID=A0A1I5Z8G8_HYMAR|nr:hypothetical protein [Hymenobacter arizonensis]SFQ52665.1 hypothetical protein SAMN04515668_2804 [Hymenobacter arizonensis]